MTLHIVAAIFAFGPTLTLPLIAAMGEASPGHRIFGLQLSAAIERRIVIPLAATMLVSGALLIVSERIDLLRTGWLLAGIVLFLVAFGLGSGHQLPATHRLIEIAGTVRSDAGGGPAGALPAEFTRVANRVKAVGALLLLLLISIAVLMIWAPGGITYR